MRRRALKAEPMHARIDDRCGKALTVRRAQCRAHTLPIDLRAEAPHPERNITQLAHADTAADKMLERVQKQKDQMVAHIGHAQRHAAALPVLRPLHQVGQLHIERGIDGIFRRKQCPVPLHDQSRVRMHIARLVRAAVVALRLCQHKARAQQHGVKVRHLRRREIQVLIA